MGRLFSHFFPPVAILSPMQAFVQGATTVSAESQRRRKLVEGLRLGKAVGLLRKLRHRGVALVDWMFTFTMGIYNRVRPRTLRAVGCT